MWKFKSDNRHLLQFITININPDRIFNPDAEITSSDDDRVPDKSLLCKDWKNQGKCNFEKRFGVPCKYAHSIVEMHEFINTSKEGNLRIFRSNKT